MENGTFSWSGGSEASLKNISLNVPQSSLVAIVGEVGSGKSSLLSALLGDMNKMDGKVNINGSLAYVSQQAWIQNATLQQNILFTSNMEQWKYEKVIEVCALKPDLDILPAGDQTEIGEKGINLSGGQKQRVSLARAVYRNADIYLLDDPLSAVDSNVASHLFQHVIGPEGLLQQKTRLLVTHNLSFLPETDWIVYLKDGAILEQGPYADLMEKRRHFAEFIESNEQKKKKKEKEEAESQSWTDVPLDATDECACNHAKAKEQQEVGFDAPKVNPGQLIEDEQIMSGKALWRVYLGYAESIGYFFLVLSVMAAALYCICEMASGVWLSDWSSDRKETIKGRNFRLTIYGVFILGQGVSIVVSAIILFTGATMAASQLHQCLVHRIMRAPQAFFDITPVGRILNRFSKDLESMDVEIPRALNFWLCSALWIPGVFVVISLTSPYVTIAFLPLLLLYYGIQKLYVTTSRQLRHLTSTTRSPLYSHFSESLSGTSVIRAFKAQDHFVNISHDRLDTHLNCSFLSIVASRWLEVCLNILGGFIVLITAILAVVERHQNPGLVGLALVYALQISQGLSVLVKISSQLETSIVALERIKEYSQVRQEAEWENPITRPPSSWPEEGAVSIQDLSTAYREGHSSVLHNITLTVKPGEKVGIVGRTGAGKSTLALTLFRIIEPTSGSIYIDNVSILCLGLHDLRSKLTIIPQDPVIFCGTLRSNLDPFESHRDAELWAALELAHLKTYVAQLEGGLDYRLTEGGENLSVGQRQLVCLARALLRKSKVLVLDEATTSLDLETDRLIQQTIGEVFARSTVITIAHRLHTVLDYDRIIVLACGEVVQDGSPKELLRDKDSTFYRLAIDAGIVNEDSVDGFTPELNS